MKIKLFENLEESVYSEIQSMIDQNQFLKGKVKADKNTVFEAGDFILLMDQNTLSHLVDAHIDETIPGSKFDKSVDLKKAIINLVTNNKQTHMTKGFGVSETNVSKPEEAEKFKWLAVDSKMNIGTENVHKLEPNSDEFKSMNLYTYKDSRGNEFKIKVKEGQGEKTTFLSFIGAKLGQIGNKIVLSVMTAFPGKNGAEVSNRNDFLKSGYYFTTTSKEVIENSAGQFSESVLTFKQFNETQQFAVLKHASDLKTEEDKRRKEKSNKQETKDDSESKTTDSNVDSEEEMETNTGEEEMENESLMTFLMFEK